MKNAEHNHLDQGRRELGECPRCDELWVEQAERTGTGRFAHQTKAELEVDKLLDREIARWSNVDKTARYGKEHPTT